MSNSTGEDHYHYWPAAHVLEKLQRIVFTEEDIFCDPVEKFLAKFSGELIEVREWSGWVSGANEYKLLSYGYTISMHPDDDRDCTLLELRETQIFDPEDDCMAGTERGKNSCDCTATKWRDCITWVREKYEVSDPEDTSRPLITFALRNMQSSDPEDWDRRPFPAKLSNL